MDDLIGRDPQGLSTRDLVSAITLSTRIVSRQSYVICIESLAHHMRAPQQGTRAVTPTEVPVHVTDHPHARLKEFLSIAARLLPVGADLREGGTHSSIGCTRAASRGGRGGRHPLRSGKQ